MILKSCKVLVKITLLIAISFSLIDCKSIKKRQTYQEYQQPYYHQQSATGNQEYVPQQQHQPISENQYQQAQLEHINQHLKHQFVRPQTQAYYNHDRVQHYQQRNYNKDQLNHGLNGRFINQHHGQQPIHFEEHHSNGEENYKQNRRHVNEHVQHVPQQQTEVKEETKKEIIEPTVNNEKPITITENHSSTSNESHSKNHSGVPKEENKTNGTEKIHDLTKKDEEVLKKELDNENEISEENLKEPNKRDEDCESKEYIAAKHEIEDKTAKEEDCESKEYIAAKHETEDETVKKEEDCESKEYIAAKHETEDETVKKEEDCESKEYIEAKQTLQENEENKEDCESVEAKHAEENGKEIITQPKELVEETSSTNSDGKPTISTAEKVEEVHQDLDPHSIPTSGDKTRNERTVIGRLHELDDPRMLIENFRHKLKTARSNIEQAEIANLRKAAPRVFIYDPNLPVIPSALPTKFQPAYVPSYQNHEDYQINEPLPHNKYRHSMIEGLKEKSANPERVITSPVADGNNFSDSSEEKKTEDNKTTGLMDENNAAKISRIAHSRNTPPEEIRQLLHVRDEINRIRHIMQVLKEHDLKQKFGSKFPNSRNLTEAEQKEMEEFVDKLKKDGKISTSPLKPQNNEDEGIQSNPGEVPDTKQLIEEIGKLKQSIKHFAKNVGVHKGDSTEANLEKLEEQIMEQKHEIENLRKLVDDLLPPTDFPSPSSSTVIKHPELEKHHLHHELKTLQATLNDLLNKEEKTLKTAQEVAGKFRARASEDESKNPKDASEKEIGTLVKILHTVQQQPAENQNSVLAKLEQMDHDIKKLDFQNNRNRQELLLEKLEREVKNLKNIKSKSGDNTEELTEKNKKLGEEIKKHNDKPTTINAKIDELEKQIQNLSKPMGRELDGNIEKELDRLEKQIKNLTPESDIKPAGRQLEGLLSDILLNSGDNSNEKHENIPPHAILNGESNQQAPIFQIPYCLQHYHGAQPGYVQPPNYQPGKQELPANYNNGPQSISYGNLKYIPHPQQVVIQSGQQFQPQKQIYSKPSQQLYQPPKPNVQPVYGPPRPPKTYPPQKPIYEEVKPINAAANQEYGPSNQYAPSSIQEQKPYGPSNQYAPSSIHEQKPCEHSQSMEEEIKKLNSMLSILNEKIDYGTDPEPEEYEGIYRSKSSKPRTKRETVNANMEESKQQLIQEIRERLADLREQVQNVDGPSANSSEEQSGKRSAYMGDSFHQPHGSKLLFKKKQKFDDLFIKIVKFIMHKLEISAPYVIESLFNGEAYEDDYGGYNNNYNNNEYRSSQKFRSEDGDADFDNYVEDNNEYDNEVQHKKQNPIGGLFNSFQGFPGLLGFIPNILLKLLSNFSSILSFLKRNKFFKNFLFPGALILVIDGIMALLIWWFSTDDTQNLFDFNFNHSSPNVENNRYL